jgi:hypothetical protein
MNQELLEKLIEEVVLQSFSDQIRRLPSNERAIFSLYLDGYTCLEIEKVLEGRCTLPFVTKTIAKIKDQLKLKYNAGLASRQV